ncbi:MAG: protein-disulfide reductase DsbD family protein [Alphaproteobacteria bacterium]
MQLPRPLRHGLAAIGVLIFSCLAATGPSVAAESAAVKTDLTEAQLVAERDAVPGETLRLGLRLRHEPKWHSYWSNPGDSGLPTEIDWSLPEGWRAGEIEWPAPHRLPSGPFVNYGFKGEFVLPVAVTVPADAQPGSSVRIEAHASWLACADICIPEEAALAIDLPVAGAAPAADPRWQDLFERARREAPQPAPWDAAVDGDAETLLLRVDAAGLRRDRLSDVYFYAFDPEAVEHAGAQRLAVDADGLTLAIPRGIAKGRPVGPIEGVLVLEKTLDGGTARQAFTLAAAVGSVAMPTFAAAGAVPGGGSATGSVGLLQAVILALGGGLLLNLMPCVFPVLFIKALGIARLGAGERREVRLHGLVYTAGVLATFGLLAGGLIALQASGAVVGWGFQLQQPVVILLLAYLMTLIGLNLAGLFDITGGANLGAGLAARPGHRGAFFTGALAVIVATPCTAPFMGVALGFAVTQPPTIALAVFLALGLGMALPFLALSLFPALAGLLPKPGPWMEGFKQFLAFPMFATAAWLVWVLAQQAGPTGVIVALGGMLLLAFGAWAWSLAPAGTARLAGRAVGVAAFAGALLLARFPMQRPAQAGVVVAGDGAVAWERFDPERIAGLRADGSAVLVNLTAAWCITCQVNERVALSSDKIGAALRSAGVVALKGDWTNGDPVITRYLSEFGRTGVPLYVLYPADASGTPTVLPQLLTEAIVLDALAALSATSNRDVRT